MLENKIVIELTREYVEEVLQANLTDKQWEVLASELEDSVDSFAWKEMQAVFENIDSLIEEDSKYNL